MGITGIDLFEDNAGKAKLYYHSWLGTSPSNEISHLYGTDLGRFKLVNISGL